MAGDTDVFDDDVISDLDELEELQTEQPVQHMSLCAPLHSEKTADVKTDAGSISHQCDACHKVFWQKTGEPLGACPYCGSRIHLEELEELHVTNHEIHPVVQQLQDKIHMGAMLLARGSTWTDTRKEQISLEQGSPEYQEYVEDLQELDPMQPDDEMHAALEDHNEDIVTRLYDKLDKDNELAQQAAQQSDPAYKINAREESLKRSMHATAVRTALASAALTETLTDDQLARAITTDNPVLYDQNVKMDDYAKALSDFVMDISH